MKGLVAGLLRSFTLCLLLSLSLGSLTITPSSRVLSEGRNYTFTCSVSSKDEGVLVIFRNGVAKQCVVKRDGVMFTAEPGTSCTGSSDDVSLFYMTIAGVTRTHNSEEWNCQVGTATSEMATLEVQYPPNMASFVANGKPENNTLDLGTSVTLQCEAEANPSPTITIRRGNAVLSRNSDVMQASENITAVSCRDMAIYYCHAENTLGSNSSRLQLFVECPPTEVDRDRGPYYASIDGEVTLHLAVLAYPDPTFTWYGPSGKQIALKTGTSNSGSIITDSVVLRGVKKEDFGDYLVQVENKFGAGNFTVTLMLKEALNKAMLVGIIVGCVVLAIFVIVFICFISRKLRKKETDADKEEYYREMERLSSIPGDDVYTEVKKPKKKELSNGDHTFSNTEESKPLQGAKTGRDDDGLVYIAVDVVDQPGGDIIGTQEGDPTPYAEVDINNTAVKYQPDPKPDH